MSDDLTLHPLVRQMIREDTRDRALTMNWGPLERDAYNRLGLRDLSPLAMKARTQIITEVLAAGERFISYSRRRAFYTENQRYYRPTYSYRGVIPAVDQLADEGLIEHEKAPPGHRGFQSRFRATPDLLKELSAVQVQYKPLELIVLRDANGNPVDYQDNRETRAMRKRLTELNEALLSQQIGIGDRIVREGDVLDNGGRAQAQLHRVFHRGDFDLGGRFYGGHWQNIPAEGGRDQITINGEPTSEVDYRGLHIRLLYQEAGKPMLGDPYDFAQRDQAKLALLIAINARSHKSAVRALADALRRGGGVGDPYATAQKLLRAAKARHPDIAWALASDAGVRLMRKDSELAERIMFETVRAIGIAPLAVHDSFIVPANQEGRLMETMESAICCGNNPPKIPCGNSLHFGDNLSSLFSTASPKTVPQYGIETEVYGVVVGTGRVVEETDRPGGLLSLSAVEKPPDAVADVPHQAEKAPPAADVIDEDEKAPPAQPEQPVSAPDPVPTRPMLPGDRRRAEIRARNQEAVQRFDAEMKRRSLH
jgi:hypothetical protein